MRFWLQILLNLVFGVLFVWGCWWLIHQLTGWEGAVIFWLALGVGGIAGAQASYLIVRRLPAPPPRPQPPAQEPAFVPDAAIEESD